MPDPCDYAPIRAVLKRHLNGEDVWYRKAGGGRKTKLTPGEQSIMADCLRRGTGQVQAAYIGTAWREQKGMSKEDLLSWDLDMCAESTRVTRDAVNYTHLD